MTRLVVEVDDLVEASRSMYSEVADPAQAGLSHLLDDLYSCASMAGSDEAGSAWAASYDPAAAATVRAAAAAINGCYRLSAMFGQTARNYAAADAASTASARRAISAEVDSLPSPTSVSFAAPPAALGGSGGGPVGWSLIQHAVGYVWPNGHQDRLHRAADAWSACAAAAAQAGDMVQFVPTSCFFDGLPEYDDMHTVCAAMCTHLRDVAHACRALASACRELAHHIDEVHSEVEHQLIELGAESFGIQVLGGILGAVTGGAAEAPTQALQAERITSVANSVRSLIMKFITLAKSVARQVEEIATRASSVATRLQSLLSVKLAAAELTVARQLHAVNEIGELVATQRLAEFAKPIADLSVDIKQIESKFKHAKDFGIVEGRGRAGFSAFRAKVKEFVSSPATLRTPGIYRKQAVVINYNPETRLVVVQSTNGAFVSGWRMSVGQLQSVTRGRSLGGG